jgi:hypothetical protein
MNIFEDCTEECERMPECKVCRKRKAPRGRDVPAVAAGSYCDRDCAGYYQDPEPGHLWPGELARSKESDE